MSCASKTIYNSTDFTDNFPLKIKYFKINWKTKIAEGFALVREKVFVDRSVYIDTVLLKFFKDQKMTIM